MFAPPFHRGQDPDKSNDIQMQKGAIKAQRCEKLDGALKLSSGGSGERRRRRRPFNTLSSLSHFFSPYRALTASCSAVTRTALGAAGASVVIVSWVRGREKCVSKRASRLLNSFFVDAQQRKKVSTKERAGKKHEFTFSLFFRALNDSSPVPILHPQHSSLSLARARALCLSNHLSKRQALSGRQYLKKTRPDLERKRRWL